MALILTLTLILVQVQAPIMGTVAPAGAMPGSYPDRELPDPDVVASLMGVTGMPKEPPIRVRVRVRPKEPPRCMYHKPLLHVRVRVRPKEPPRS